MIRLHHKWLTSAPWIALCQTGQRVAIVVGMAVLLGLGMAQWMAQAAPPLPSHIAQANPLPPNDSVEAPVEPLSTAALPAIGTVDPITPEFYLGQQRYLEACATCHIALPPAILPDETWRQLLQGGWHYGATLPVLLPTQQTVIWEYLREYSRPLRPNERIPFNISDSRYFNALHPQVTFPEPVSVNSCTACHVGGDRYNFRQLTAEWQ